MVMNVSLSKYSKMANVYQIITGRIAGMLEEGTVPWKKPWKGSQFTPKNLVSGKEYRGLNIFMLASAGFENPYWLTYKQSASRGGQVKKGEHGWPCIFWKPVQGRDKETGEKKNFPLLRYYTVFNVEQTEGFDYPKVEIPNLDFTPIEQCESLVEKMQSPPGIEHGGGQAFYRPPADLVGMPKQERFNGEEEYYSTLFHELTHSTGHESRLNRKEVAKRTYFGSSDYSREELVAEMGAAFLCGHTGIENKILGNSAAYISSWLGKLKDDKTLVVRAGAQAQKASDYVLGKELVVAGTEGNDGG